MTTFGYQTIMKSDESGTLTSLIAYEVQVTRPLRAVIWNVPTQEWIYAPAVASAFLYDPAYQERTEEIDRTTAERLARQELPKELPSEEVLLTMLDEGEQNGWTWGPPAEEAHPGSPSS